MPSLAEVQDQKRLKPGVSVEERLNDPLRAPAAMEDDGGPAQGLQRTKFEYWLLLFRSDASDYKGLAYFHAVTM